MFNGCRHLRLRQRRARGGQGTPTAQNHDDRHPGYEKHSHDSPSSRKLIQWRRKQRLPRSRSFVLGTRKRCKEIVSTTLYFVHVTAAGYFLAHRCQTRSRAVHRGCSRRCLRDQWPFAITRRRAYCHGSASAGFAHGGHVALDRERGCRCRSGAQFVAGIDECRKAHGCLHDDTPARGEPYHSLTAEPHRSAEIVSKER